MKLSLTENEKKPMTNSSRTNKTKVKSDIVSQGSIIGLSEVKTSLHEKIRLYKKRSQEIEKHLEIIPEDWGKFQSEVNREVDAMFRDIMNFEKINFAQQRAEKVLKLKNLFAKRIRKLFMRGDYGTWSILKPYGYAGDFKIIDDIYQNNPSTTGYDRLLDNYFQMSAISVAVRNRKEDFKRLLLSFARKKKDCSLRIMSLACGACRDIEEILSSDFSLNRTLIFDCYDNDENAIKFARRLLTPYPNVHFITKNALRLAASRDIRSEVKCKYDFIYSTGLFDYLNNKVSTRLIQNLKKLLNPKGVLAIANVRDKYSNPSVYYMEWIGDWPLLYRSDEGFKKIFIDAGFKEKELTRKYEQQGILQYIVAVNSE